MKYALALFGFLLAYPWVMTAAAKFHEVANALATVNGLN